MGTITPVILSGGSGTRLWPLSRQARPKQFHALGGPRTLIQETALRVAGPGFAPPVVVASEGHLDLVVEQLSTVGAPPQAVLLEPGPRNTAAAAAAAAGWLARNDPGALVLLIHADNRVADADAYRRTVAQGVPAAEAGSLVIFGIRPTSPETGYGYIRAGAGDGPARPVAAFVEKPDRATAQAYLADPAYSWNAGMFLFRADAFLAELARTAPAIASASARAVAAAAQQDHGVVRLGRAFLDAPAEPIDTAVFEKTRLARVVAADFAWSDVGAWDAVWAETPRDEAGNAQVGPGLAVDAANCLVISDGAPVILAGVQDLAVVVEGGVVLVARRDDPEALRRAVAALRAAGRDDLL